MQELLKSPNFKFYRLQWKSDNKLPLFSSSVSCGFANVAEDYIEERIDLKEYLITNPLSTFLVRARGNSMEGSRIFDGSLLIVDRSISPGPRSVCLCILNTEFTVKKIRKESGKIFLVPTNRRYPEIPVTEDMDFQIWGVITKVITEPV